MAKTTSSANPPKVLEPTLFVGIEIRGVNHFVGELRCAQSTQDFVASFQYAPSYLSLAQSGHAFALDPINLPLRTDPYKTTGRHSILGVLFDAAPDAWGRTVMALDEGVSSVSLTEARVLLKGKGAGVGAIFFTTQPFESGFALPVYPTSRLDQVPELYEIVRRIENGLTLDVHSRALLKSSWDIGGARPKAVVQDVDGAQWIAKFPRGIDTFSRQRVEWANLQMAKEIGMQVPDAQLIELDGDDCALLVRRFDRTVQSGHDQVLGRQHYISAASLISPPADFDKYKMDTAFGASYFSYARIADVVRRLSTHAASDLTELYARMVLNVLVHNTDDHLKNTGFLLDASSQSYGLRLAPLFDVVTQEGGSLHMLHLGPGPNKTRSYQSGRFGSLDNVLSGAKGCAIKPVAASAIIERVQSVFERRLEFYQQAKMQQQDIDSVEACVMQRG